MQGPEFKSKIYTARELFKNGDPVDKELVRPIILESWERSRSYGLEFDNLAKTVLPKSALKRRIEDRRTLFDIALPIMQSLHPFTTGSGFVSTLSDEDGYVLKILGDPEILRKAAHDNGMVEGCNRSEHRIGTNGIGTALVIQEPIQVVAGEHYYPLHPHWVCSGAPIFDEEGSVIGSFCLTGLGDRVSFHTLGMAAAAASAITRQIKMQCAYDKLNRLQQRMGVIVETMPTGILLLNNELEILQDNSWAESLLKKPGTELVGKSILDIFDGLPKDEERLRQGLDSYTVSAKHGRERLYYSLNIQPTATDEFVLTFEKTESLHKKVHRVIGPGAHFTFSDIVGQSPAIQEALSLARIAAGNASNVLLTGESGTGKELFAQAIHNGGTRKDGPFVAINCGALPKSLIESELFGYSGGAFTGARRDGSVGKFELANGGTIFLDEIGDMPLEVQATLLRVLQNKEVTPIGSNRVVGIDVRIIAATNQDLPAAMAAGAFRSDLYYRLNVFSIRVPPLRERAGDIRLLADYFLQKYGDPANKELAGFSKEAYSLLEGREWLGNVRELENSVERAFYLAKEKHVSAECLSPMFKAAPAQRPAQQTLAPMSSPLRDGFPQISKPKPGRESLVQALHATGGNVKQAADLLGVSRRTMYRKLNEFGIDYEQIRSTVRS
jgi:transcriptional regulator of acetoin/glycerol metabolism